MALSETFSELFYSVKRNAGYGAGKESAMLLGAAQGSVLGLGLAAGVSAALTQMDYIHKKNNLTNFYKEEIAAKQHKHIDHVTVEDLESLAGMDKKKIGQTNHVFSEEVRKAKSRRNFGIVFSVVASIGAIGAVVGMAPALDVLAGQILSKGAGELAHYAVHFVLHAAAGVAAYNVIKTPIHWLGDKLFGLDKKTTHDRIAEIKRDHDDGKVITQEEVLSVFVSANKELADFIQVKYGKPFDKLVYADKHAIAEHVGEMVNLQQITENINHGRLNATELAFTVEGQVSGVGLKEGQNREKRGVLLAMKEKFHRVIERWNEPHQPAPALATVAHSAPHSMPEVYSNDPQAVSHVARLGRPRHNAELGHVQRLEQSRGDQLVTRS